MGAAGNLIALYGSADVGTFPRWFVYLVWVVLLLCAAIWWVRRRRR